MPQTTPNTVLVRLKDNIQHIGMHANEVKDRIITQKLQATASSARCMELKLIDQMLLIEVI